MRSPTGPPLRRGPSGRAWRATRCPTRCRRCLCLCGCACRPCLCVRVRASVQGQRGVEARPLRSEKRGGSTNTRGEGCGCPCSVVRTLYSTASPSEAVSRVSHVDILLLDLFARSLPSYFFILTAYSTVPLCLPCHLASSSLCLGRMLRRLRPRRPSASQLPGDRVRLSFRLALLLPLNERIWLLTHTHS